MADTIKKIDPVTYEVGKNNMGGYKNHVALIPFNYFEDASGCPVASADDPTVAEGQWKFKEGCAPIFCYATDETTKYTAEGQGEIDGKSYAPKFEFFFPGNARSMHKFNDLIKNTPCIVVIEDSDGEQQIIGEPGLFAYIAPSMEGGQKRADRRGTTYSGQCSSNHSGVFLPEGLKLVFDDFRQTVELPGTKAPDAP